MKPQQRTRVHSLVGMQVILISMDGVPVVNADVVVEEVSEYGFLFRDSKGTLIFGSSASFTVRPTPVQTEVHDPLDYGG